MSPKTRSTILVLCLAAFAAALLSGCAGAKRQRAKLALASCSLEILGAAPVVDGAEPIVRVPQTDGTERVHDLRRPSLALFADLPAILEGRAEWQLRNAGARLRVRVGNSGSDTLVLDSLSFVLRFAECAVPARASEPLVLPARGAVEREIELRLDVDNSVLACMDGAETLTTEMRALFGFGTNDPEPVWLELENRGEFPRDRILAELEASKQSLMNRMLGR